ncbi:hypothetical protein GFS31_26130 [Leptolyngbya sp. BL0902]|nr:hypothetical protein GFS31_26130 [Leptolyngbya sp. BL0902]
MEKDSVTAAIIQLVTAQYISPQPTTIQPAFSDHHPSAKAAA